MLTVGLNPSRNEFPEGDPFQRFPLAEDAAAADRQRYLDALSAYFRTRPYAQWFNSFEPLLNGMGASYYDGRTATVVRTDICSPIATDSTWSQLGEADRRVLVDDGRTLWHELLAALQPNVVLPVCRQEPPGSHPVRPAGTVGTYPHVQSQSRWCVSQAPVQSPWPLASGR